jgi:hypothetical protein
MGIFYITSGCIETNEIFWVSEVRYFINKTKHKKLFLSIKDKIFDTCLFSDADRFDAITRLTYLMKSVDIQGREEIREALRAQLNDVPPFPNNLMLTWQQLREMAAMGMEIGGHTMTHPNLPSAQADEASLEIGQCKELLEKQLGVKVNHFAYPNGGSACHYDERVKKLVSQSGFLSATTSKAGLVAGNVDLFEVRRMRATENLCDMLWEIEETRIRRQ